VTPRRGSAVIRATRAEPEKTEARAAWDAMAEDDTTLRETPSSKDGQVVAAPLAAGSRLRRRYELLHEVDRGGVGTVWAARDAATDRTVAVKLVPSGDARIDERFRREVAIGREIAGEHFVPLIDFGEERNHAWFVMELLRGEDLAARLDRRRVLRTAELLRVANDLATALDAAHVAGLVHRDLKPKNVFLALDANGAETLKVLDFGAAKQVLYASKLTATGVLLGSPHYMSPEQIECGREVDHQTDLWAFGAILYRCLVGQRPFEGELAALLMRVRTEEPPAPSTLVPFLSPAADAVFARALAKDPRRRFSSARALADALAKSLEA